MAVILDGGKLTLSGFVGDYYFEDGFTSSDVVLALAEVEENSDLEVHVNSPGGIASEGAAIHALLSARPGTTNIVVEGVAASAASLIAMAGATVTMSAGAIMMIHDPSGYTFGTSNDHSKSIESLEALATAYSRVYAAKSGKTPDECREIMKAERWFTPEQAVAEGFADATTEIKAAPVAAFDYRIFAHAPQRLKTLASKKNWSLPEANNPAGSAAPSSQNQEKSMTDKERADQLAAENNTLKTSLTTATADATKNTAATAADIVDVCAAAGVPAMASALIREGATLDQAKARASGAEEIRIAVAVARKSCPKIEANAADAFIAAGMPIAEVRAKLFEQITAAQSPEITSAHQAETGGDDAAKTAARIVARVRPATRTEQKGA